MFYIPVSAKQSNSLPTLERWNQVSDTFPLCSGCHLGHWDAAASSLPTTTNEWHWSSFTAETSHVLSLACNTLSKSECQRREPHTYLSFDRYIHTEEMSSGSVSVPYAVTQVQRASRCLGARRLAEWHFHNTKNSNKVPSSPAGFLLSICYNLNHQFKHLVLLQRTEQAVGTVQNVA